MGSLKEEGSVSRIARIPWVCVHLRVQVGVDQLCSNSNSKITRCSKVSLHPSLRTPSIATLRMAVGVTCLIRHLPILGTAVIRCHHRHLGSSHPHRRLPRSATPLETALQHSRERTTAISLRQCNPVSRLSASRLHLIHMPIYPNPLAQSWKTSIIQSPIARYPRLLIA